jgi:hypothetical protein
LAGVWVVFDKRSFLFDGVQKVRAKEEDTLS